MKHDSQMHNGQAFRVFQYRPAFPLGLENAFIDGVGVATYLQLQNGSDVALDLGREQGCGEPCQAWPFVRNRRPCIR
jgi:hypothetical protein